MKDFRTKEQRKGDGVWVVDQDGNKSKVNSKRLHRFTGDEHFRLADSDDFFGFDVTKEDKSLLRITGYAIAGIILLAIVWSGLARMQDYCMRVNAGDITLCQ